MNRPLTRSKAIALTPPRPAPRALIAEQAARISAVALALLVLVLLIRLPAGAG